MNTKLVNIPSYISIEVVNYINEQLTNEEDFDSEVFNSWLVSKDIEHKNNPNAYIRSCFIKELQKGTFKPQPKVEYIPNTQVLINEMRDRGICVLANDSAYIYVLWKYIINEAKITIDECVRLNRTILSFMKRGQSFNEYKRLLKKSNTLKAYHINWDYIEDKTNELIKKWDDTLEALESEE